MGGFLSGLWDEEYIRLLMARKAEIGRMGRTVDPVRDHTKAEVQARIDTQTRANILYYADKGVEEITRRIGELDREWTLDRALMAMASGAALAGLGLHRFLGPRWLALPALAALFLLEHVLKGWFLTASLFRKLGFRTDGEVQFEKHALKLLRGDFTVFSHGDGRDEREKLVEELMRSSL